MCNERPTTFSRRLYLLLLPAYPIAVHIGVISGVMWPALALLLLLFILPLLTSYPPILQLLAIALFAVVSAFMFPHLPPEAGKLVYAPPLLMPLFLLLLFGRSLLPGRQPLVSRIALLMHEQPSRQLLRYTRAVTIAWVLFFAAMVLEVLYLGLYASDIDWSLFTNFYNYLFIVLFFLLEFLLRRWFVAGHERLSAAGFLRGLLRIDYRRLFGKP